jgi:hypothetical protein
MTTTERLLPDGEEIVIVAVSRDDETLLTPSTPGPRYVERPRSAATIELVHERVGRRDRHDGQ